MSDKIDLGTNLVFEKKQAEVLGCVVQIVCLWRIPVVVSEQFQNKVLQPIICYIANLKTGSRP